MVHECKQSTTTSRTHVKTNFQMNTFHDNFKAWMDFYRHCVCLISYLKYTFSFCKVKLWQSNRGIPVAIVMLSNLHDYSWVVLLQCTAFQWCRHGNQGFLLAEKGIPKTTHSYIVVECPISWLWMVSPFIIYQSSKRCWPIRCLKTYLKPWTWNILHRKIGVVTAKCVEFISSNIVLNW